MRSATCRSCLLPFPRPHPSRRMLITAVLPSVLCRRSVGNTGNLSLQEKLKIKLTEINQNPFRQSLLDVRADGNSDGGGSDDISEDMSWGFDQSFFGKDSDHSDEDEDYDEI